MIMKAIDLIAFDVDGTLVRHPSGRVIWEVLNLRYGGSEAINRERFDMFRAGRITYDQWVEMDVSGWIAGGATRDQIMEMVGEFQLIDGAREAVHELKDRGFKLAVISGSIDVVLDGLFPDHPFDVVHTNRIFFDDEGRLTSWQATPYDGDGKVEALKEITRAHGVPLARAAFVGDGENDESVLGVSGYFVAVQPRSRLLAERADVVISENHLRGLPALFAMQRREA